MNEEEKNGDPPKGAAALVHPTNGRTAHEVQPYGTTVKLPLALDQKTCAANIYNLNRLLADTFTLRDLYKKHHWQASGPTFYQLHLLFDKHSAEQTQLVDLLAERIQTLGGISIAMAADVAEISLIPRPPRGRENPQAQMRRLLHAHEIVLKEARTMARLAAGNEDTGTNDILVTHVIRANELQVWLVSQHLEPA